MICEQQLLSCLFFRTWKERIVVQCIRNGIALFSPHTSWDVSPGGVSDWLSRALPIESSESVPENGAGRLCKLTEPLSVREAIQKIKAHTGIPHLRLALAVGKDLGTYKTEALFYLRNVILLSILPLQLSNVYHPVYICTFVY